MFNSIKINKSIKLKADWVLKYTNCDDDILNVFAFICVEAIFFSSSFGFFYYLKAQNNKKIPQSLIHSNDEISKDENIHILFGIEFFKILKKTKRIDYNLLNEMLQSAIETEYNFLDEILPNDLCGLTKEEMKLHVNYMAHYILSEIGDVNLKYVGDFKILRYIKDRMGQADVTNFFKKHKTDYTLY